MLLGLLLGGCATRATNLNDDLVSADNLCRQHKYRTQTELAQCYDSNERAAIQKDLPSLLYSYDLYNSARTGAARDFDNKVMSARQSADTAFKGAIEESTRKLNAATAADWHYNQTETAALKRDADRAATAACKRDGLYLSSSMVVNYKCERDIRLPLTEKMIPTASDAVHDFYNDLLGAAATYDELCFQSFRKPQRMSRRQWSQRKRRLRQKCRQSYKQMPTKRRGNAKN